MTVEKVNKLVKIDLKEKLKEELPQAFEDNKINFEKLKALLSGEIIEKEDDRFYFNWAGKNNIFKLIQAPAYGTLKPDKEKSVNFDHTENIIIVGENLETLKLLLKPYFGKVKMIYIDPPYNTGKDFIYRDNFKEPVRDYLEKTGQIDSEGQKLTTNTEASGRYHSDWLNFMYPRLFLARSLLRDDGVIFISIDDHEVHHLRMIMDEIFGEENFIINFIWKKKSTSTNVEGVQVSSLTDYVLTYGKTINSKLKTRIRSKDTRNYPYEDAEGRYRLTIIEKKHAGAYQRESMRFPIMGVYPREGKRWQIGMETAKELERKKRFILDDGIVKLKIYEFEDKDTVSAQPNLHRYFWISRNI
jgi:adenine-specific DNA-methyltransferase